MTIITVDHVSLPVTDLEDAVAFYTKILNLVQVPRPSFPFKGLWFDLGDRKLHLILHEKRLSTFRLGKPVDSHDSHFAVRVEDYVAALTHLQQAGYSEHAPNEFMRLRVSPNPTAGFPQIFLMDPDRNVIELNATRNLSPAEEQQVQTIRDAMKPN